MAELTAAGSDPRFRSRKGLATMLAIAVLGPAVFLILPVFIDALADAFGFSESQLGTLGSADLIGMSVATASGLYWVRRWPWHRVVYIALSVIVAGNFVSAFLSSYESLLVTRLIVGLASGMLYPIGMTFFARWGDANRAAATLYICQVSFIVIAFVTLPLLFAQWGVSSVFVVFAIAAVTLFRFVKLLPAGLEPDEHRVEQARGLLAPVMILIGVVLFFVGQSGMWGFVVLLGEASGIAPEDITWALVISTSVGLLGPFTAVALGDRFGILIPISVALVVQLVAVSLLGFSDLAAASYILYLSLFQTFWNLPLSYQFVALVRADVTGRVIVLMPTAQGAGIALGPMVAGHSLELSGFAALAGVTVTTLVLYGLCVIPFARARGRAAREG